MPIIMKIALFLVLLALAESRYYYYDYEPVKSRDRAIYDNYEQSSRDLDLAFSVGDSPDDVTPIRSKKVYKAPPERQMIDADRDYERPVYYRIADVPRRRNYEDVILVPDNRRKQIRVNDDDKGEVVVDLRVIVNHDED